MDAPAASSSRASRCTPWSPTADEPETVGSVDDDPVPVELRRALERPAPDHLTGVARLRAAGQHGVPDPRVQPVRADDEIEPFARAVGQLDVDAVRVLGESRDGRARPHRRAELAQGVGEDLVQRHARHGHRGRRLGLVDVELRERADRVAVRAEEIDRRVGLARCDALLVEAQRLECPQRRALQEQPDARRAPVVLDLHDLGGDAAARERDRGGHAGGAAADDEDTTHVGHDATGSGVPR